MSLLILVKTEGIPPTWDVSSMSYSGKFADVSDKAVEPVDITFKPDGTHMYVQDNHYIVGGGGIQSGFIWQYELSTPWDISTASYDNREIYTIPHAVNDLEPQTLKLRDDGDRVFMTGSFGGWTIEYNLDTPYEMHTFSYTRSAQLNGGGFGMFIKPDGTAFFMVDRNAARIRRIPLPTPWRIDFASPYDQQFFVSGQEATPYDVEFNTDGTRMFVMGTSTDSVHQYDLSVAWDMSSSTYIGSFSFASEETNPRGYEFKPDGSKMYLVGFGKKVYQYDLGT